MRDWDSELQAILADPFFDDVKPVKRRVTSSDRLVNSFIEVLDFVEKEGREPSEKAESLEELKLFRTLRSIRTDENKRNACISVDTAGLLSTVSDIEEGYKKPIIESTPIESVVPADKSDCQNELDAILNDPIFDNVTSDSGSLFDIPDYMQKRMKERTEAESIAKRTNCKDFADFEEGFQIIHKKLEDGRCRLVRFKEAHLIEGRYFVVGNMLLYLSHLNKNAKRRDSRGRADGRTRCIFENGTESNVYQQTLVKSLYTEGYTVADHSDIEDAFLLKHFTKGVNDVISGWIYILKSLSTNPKIAEQQDLYKIGFTRQTVEERIANARNESTYLFADVQIIKTYQVANIKASTFEKLIHKLFDAVQLQIVAGIAKPKEWYIVPFPIVDQAIHCIIEGIPVAYDKTLQQLIYR